MGRCFLCLTLEDVTACVNCKDTFYCHNHKTNHLSQSGSCVPFKVEYDPEIGRYLVATRRIKQGELILFESPSVIGPCTRSKPQCLECFKKISWNKFYRCSKCRFPLCSKECEEGNYHKAECDLLNSVDYKAEDGQIDDFYPAYSAITVLRLLLLLERISVFGEGSKYESKQENSDRMWDHMMDHNEERKLEQPEAWKFEKEFIVNFIHKVRIYIVCHFANQIRLWIFSSNLTKGFQRK